MSEKLTLEGLTKEYSHHYMDEGLSSTGKKIVSILNDFEIEGGSVVSESYSGCGNMIEIRLLLKNRKYSQLTAEVSSDSDRRYVYFLWEEKKIAVWQSYIETSTAQAVIQYHSGLRHLPQKIVRYVKNIGLFDSFYTKDFMGSYEEGYRCILK